MEQLVAVARSLREEHDFRGYIHLKTIPDADPELARQAGLYADRLLINVELPTEQGLRRLAPEKDGQRIESAMAGMSDDIEEDWKSTRLNSSHKSAHRMTSPARKTKSLKLNIENQQYNTYDNLQLYAVLNTYILLFT